MKTGSWSKRTFRCVEVDLPKKRRAINTVVNQVKSIFDKSCESYVGLATYIEDGKLR